MENNKGGRVVMTLEGLADILYGQHLTVFSHIRLAGIYFYGISLKGHSIYVRPKVTLNECAGITRTQVLCRGEFHEEIKNFHLNLKWCTFKRSMKRAIILLLLSCCENFWTWKYEYMFKKYLNPIYFCCIGYYYVAG